MSGVIRRQRYDISTDPSFDRVRRWVVSWLGLMILAFNVLGSGALPAQASGTPLFAQEMLGDRIVVCTAAGMVVMDRDGNVLDTGGTAAHDNFCVFCLPLMHGVAQPTAVQAVVLAIPATPPDEFTPAPAASAKPALLRGASSPRAPPLS